MKNSSPKQFEWYWKIKRSGGGPDYYLLLKFAMDDTEFMQWIEGLLAKDYTLNSLNHRMWSHRDSRFSSYVNVTVYPGAEIEIALGWGVERREANELLQQLLSPPYVETLMQWQVHAGGQGYVSKAFGRGTDVASFLDYCQGCDR